ncbi:MAG: VWA domain-containing protein [Pyrinomonadaceae bacterium]
MNLITKLIVAQIMVWLFCLVSPAQSQPAARPEYLKFDDPPCAQVSKPTTKLNVSIWNSRKDEYVRNLRAEDLDINIDKEVKSLSSLRFRDEPISVGLIIDLSESMGGTFRGWKSTAIPLAIEGLKHFINQSNPKDEYFILGFSTSIFGFVEFSDDTKIILPALDEAPKTLLTGGTNLFDALNVGLNKISYGKYERRILILLSDGLENASKKYDHKKFQKNLRQCSDVNIFMIDTSGSQWLNAIHTNVTNTDATNNHMINTNVTYTASPDRTIGPIEDSGGRVFKESTPAGVKKAFESLVNELRNQYVLEIATPNSNKDSWRKMKFNLKLPKEAGKFVVRSPKGCFC